MQSRIMYIEFKGTGITGPARIGNVEFSKSGRSIYYRGRRLQKILRSGYKANYFDPETGDEYWISGCKRNGGDRLYSGTIEIDENVRETYWTEIRQQPESVGKRQIRCVGKYGGRKGKAY
jgi:hypothetical protein